jgi:serine/threonine-protein kinase
MIPGVGKRALGSQYFLDEQIGRGGMGTVWRGQDRTTRASYAIKVLNESLATDPVAVARFVRERTALMSFRHPHVVTLHDMIVERDTLALVMDLIPGGDLNQLRHDHGGRLEPRQALELTAQVAEALAAAHAAGIVHRDIKPANILLRADDDALLADFGIAHLAVQARDTTAGVMLGTAEYLAPEVIAGQDPGPEGDLYALGVTLYQLVAGVPPFTGNPAAVLHAHVADLPVRPPEMDDDVWQVVSRCLEKDPARRPPAEALATRLRRLAALSRPAQFTDQRPTGPVADQRPTGPDADQYGLSSPFYQVQMQPLSEITQPEHRPRERRPRPSIPRPSRKVMTITASVAALVALTAAIVIVNPFSSPAAKNAGETLAAPTTTSGASALATTSASSSGPGSNGKKQPGTKGQPTGPTSSAASTKPGAHPSAGAPASSSGASPSSGTNPSSGGTPAPTGTPDDYGFTILDASASQEVHHCEQLGIDRLGYQAIICFDIDTYPSGSNYFATGEVEAYCQTIAGAAVQCPQITLTGSFTEGVEGSTLIQKTWTCGGSAAACPDGRWVQPITTFEWSDANSANCSNGLTLTTDVWTNVVDPTTSIELPNSDATYTLNSSDGGTDGNDYSSGHYWICQSLSPNRHPPPATHPRPHPTRAAGAACPTAHALSRHGATGSASPHYRPPPPPSVKLASRSCRTNFTLIPASSGSISRFLACCTTQDWHPDPAGAVLNHGQDVDLRAVEQVGGEEVQRQDSCA